MQMITTPHTELEVNKESVACNLEMYGSVCSPFKKKKTSCHIVFTPDYFSQHYVVHESNAFNHFLVLSKSRVSDYLFFFFFFFLPQCSTPFFCGK